MSSQKKPKALEVIGMCYGPHGVGKLQGKTYFVENGLVGDEVTISVTKDKDRYAFAKVDNTDQRSV